MSEVIHQGRDDHLPDEPLCWEDVDSFEALRALVAKDAHAASFQTMRQYRTAILRHIDELLAAAPAGQKQVRTWRQRINVGKDWPLHAPNDVERAMVTEIAELRMALARVQRDAARIDWLEEMGNVPGGLLLHDGSDFTGRCGLGLRRIARTLRQAVDAARGDRHGR